MDVSFQYLTFFVEDDDELEDIRQRYKKGELLTGELKKLCITELQKVVKEFQEKRKAITAEQLKTFMTPRALQWGTGKEKERAAKAAAAAKEAKEAAAAAATKETKEA